ncbi:MULTISPECIES: hypothetical protein [Brucella]|uniref:Uncharacterized protein n=1 Tax=Brucella cytisi TaxID=407152 RepID=A0A1J6HCI5_9HYPH|nr:hypothetical protein [Brucella cytisi]OIS90297.1 hypothetical protein BLA27_27520 [Brucella cytisi]
MNIVNIGGRFGKAGDNLPLCRSRSSMGRSCSADTYRSQSPHDSGNGLGDLRQRHAEVSACVRRSRFSRFISSA